MTAAACRSDPLWRVAGRPAWRPDHTGDGFADVTITEAI